MSSNVGRYTPVAGVMQNVDTGMPWEYIRVINSSPYLLSLSLGGQGTIDFPEMYLEDIKIQQSFNGKLSFTPFANIVNPSLALTNYVSINVYQHGEIKQPQAQPLTTMSNVGNSVPINSTATAVANDGNPAGTKFIEASVSGIEHIAAFNDGFLRIEKDCTSADQNFNAWIDIQPGGHNWEVYLKTGATHGWALEDITAAITALLIDSSGNITSIAKYTSTKPHASAQQSIIEYAPSDDATVDWIEAVSSTGNWLLVDNHAGVQTAVWAGGAAGGLKLTNKGNFIQAWSFFTGTTTGTYSHGLGATPNVVLPMCSVNGSQTMGWDTPTSTQVHITSFSGLGFTALALLMA